MRTTLYCLLACLVLFSAGTLIAQTQTGEIKVLSVPDRYKSGNGNESTNGLPNVGVGARVVLAPFVWTGTGTKYSDSTVAITSATWTVTGPKGSVTIADTAAGLNGKVVYFKPDTTGSFTVNASITTARGVAAASIIIKAANFKGVGVYNLSTMSWKSTTFNCAPCHDQTQGEFAEFKKTNHASAAARKINEVGGHFGNSCLSCHSVGYNTSTTAKNNGFDDWMSLTGYTTPTNGAGKYDSLVAIADTNANWKSLMSTMGIQCENCHGPAGEHVKTGDPGLLAASWSSDVCAPCHFSSDRHPKGYSWAETAHAKSFTEGVQPEGLNRASCARCHTGTGYVNQTINGNPEPTPATSSSKLYNPGAPITCQACHDPHDNTGKEYQLRSKTVADACTGCHITRLSSRGLHHSHQGSMLIGRDFTPMSAAVLTSTSTIIGNYSGWQFPGYVYENGSHSDIANRCAECHMANSPDFDPTFATPDTLLNKVGGHTFKIVYDPGTPLVATDDILNDTGCKECHGSVSLEFVELSQAKTKALMAQLYALLPKRDTSKTTYPNGTPSTPRDTVAWQSNGPVGAQKVKLTTAQIAACYNYYFLDYDGSYGVHNPKYAEQLMKSSIEQLTLGAGAANITSAKDVPNDQGRRVQLVWNAFPAEKFAYNPVVMYGVWREDKIVGTKVVAEPRKSFTDMLNNSVVGGKYSVNATVWTYVAAVPATKLQQYGYVCETILDSTSTGNGVTNFQIAGYAVNSAAVYLSPIMSGYSIDNIPPFKVTTFSVTVNTSGAVLNWKPIDQDDVVKFIVYRGTTANFTPAAGNKIAEVAIANFSNATYLDAGVTATQVYFYKLQGVDKSGNLGEISAPAGTVGVEQVDGTPTTYALGQNYPNPFNPTTVIPFALPSTGHVSLKVYTISGELVTTLVDREMGAGNYQVTWNGRGNAGEAVASGMYLYRLQTDNFTSVKKMVMLK